MIEESIAKLKRFKYHAIGRLELEDAIDDVVSWYEQMLKEAVEVTVQSPILGPPMVCCIANSCSDGDKVHIVILKEDEE